MLRMEVNLPTLSITEHKCFNYGNTESEISSEYTLHSAYNYEYCYIVKSNVYFQKIDSQGSNVSKDDRSESVPHLLNLNEDGMLSKLLRFFIESGKYSTFV
jgi:hypothetical protein